jgi:CMP/dCMP kinase
MIIAFGGRAGAGKSTLAKRLAKFLGFDHYSMGDVQRELAAERGLTIAQWGEIEKNDPSFDRLVDNKQTELGRDRDNFVIDAWLAPHFIPRAVKIFIDASPAVRARRRLKSGRITESYGDEAEAIRMMKEREETNRRRWIDFYGFDFLDKSKFDLVLDTDNLNEDEVFEAVRRFIESKRQNQ